MKKMLLFMMMLFATYANANTNRSLNSPIQTSATKLVEIVLTLPFEEFIIQPDGIAVNYDGNLLAVHSLEKSGDLWVARARGKCGNGHTVVCRCGGCAVSSCGYCCSCYGYHNDKP